MNDQEKRVARIIKTAVFAFIALIVVFGSFSIISAGDRGVVLRMGSMNRVMDEGFNWKFPMIESVKKFDVRTQKEQIDAQAASKDLQNVSATVAINYNLEHSKVGELFRSIGEEYKTRIIDPAIQESVKASTANYTAEELITKRAIVRDEIKKNITERLSKEYIVVTEVSIVNFNFSQSFNEAIEAKVTAEQNALAAKNKLEQVKFEADQRIVQSRGEAEAIRIQAQAITQQGGAEYVKLKTVEKWDGKYPFVMGGSSIVNVPMEAIAGIVNK